MSDQKNGLEKTEAIYSMYKDFKGQHAFAGAYGFKFDGEGEIVNISIPVSGDELNISRKDRYETASGSISKKIIEKIYDMTDDEFLKENMDDEGLLNHSPVRYNVGQQKVEEFNCGIYEILKPFEKLEGVKKFAENYKVTEARACEILHKESNIFSFFKTNEVALHLENCVQEKLIATIAANRIEYYNHD